MSEYLEGQQYNPKEKEDAAEFLTFIVDKLFNEN